MQSRSCETPFSVEDVDKVATQPANAGAKLLQSPSEMFWGHRTAVLDGVGFSEVMEPVDSLGVVVFHQEDGALLASGAREQR